VEQILPLLEMIAREGRALIVVAEDIEGQALAAIIMNAMRGTMKVAGIKAPLYGEERRNTLDDLAASTGATFITRESGIKLQDVKMSDLGTAKFIESAKYSTTIVGGNCDFEEVEKRIEALKNLIQQTDSIQECERIQNRIVRLASGVAVIRVGGATEVEMTEKKHRIEDALEAVRSAQEEGIISGGGIALLRASNNIEIEAENDEQVLGVSIVKEACKEPLRQMALNAGESPDLIISSVLSADENEGWDFRLGRLTNLMKSGIIDPVKVTRTALQNAASCAGTLITTNFGIIQV
jgi:chaperonin GroEL